MHACVTHIHTYKTKHAHTHTHTHSLHNMYIYIYIYTHTYAYIHVHTHTHIHIHMHTHIVYMHTLWSKTDSCLPTRMCHYSGLQRCMMTTQTTYVSIYIYIYIYIYMYIHTYVHTYYSASMKQSRFVLGYKDVRLHEVYIYLYIYIYKYKYIYIYIYTHTHPNTYVRTYILQSKHEAKPIRACLQGCAAARSVQWSLWNIAADGRFKC
jgi:hypothetical protein